MCVTFVYLNPNAVGNENDYQLIILNNRDESLDRPTSLAAWKEGILAGRDEALNDRGGTWLGMKKNGKIGVLLSMLEKQSVMKPNSPTRGTIINDYLTSNYTANEYSEIIAKQGSLFNGFNLLLFDRSERNGKVMYNLATVGNSQGNTTVENFESGIYGFGNSPRLSPFKKVAYGTQLFQNALQDIRGHNESTLIKRFLKILRDSTGHYPDKQLLSQTDQEEGCSRAMSQLCYQFPPPYRYGTRSHTIVTITGTGRVVYYESSRFGGDGRDESHDLSQWPVTKFVFQLYDP